MTGKLTPKQARFVEEYLADFNGQQAAIRAGMRLVKTEIDSPKDYYVYGLVSPLTDQLFYIGKGKGRRLFQHSADAVAGRVTNAGRHVALYEIFLAGKRPGYVIFGEGLSEDAAISCERYLIVSVGLSQLMNLVPGRQSGRERSMWKAKAMLVRVIPFEDWKNRCQPTPQDCEMYQRIVGELEAVAVDGAISSLCVRDGEVEFGY